MTFLVESPDFQLIFPKYSGFKYSIIDTCYSYSYIVKTSLFCYSLALVFTFLKIYSVCSIEFRVYFSGYCISISSLKPRVRRVTQRDGPWTVKVHCWQSTTVSVIFNDWERGVFFQICDLNERSHFKTKFHNFQCNKYW